MHALIQTVAFRGIDTTSVNVQVHIANGLPAIAVVGLADSATGCFSSRFLDLLRAIFTSAMGYFHLRMCDKVKSARSNWR